MSTVKKNPIDEFFSFVQKPLGNAFNKFSVGINNPLPQPFDVNSVVKNKVKTSVQSFPFDLKTNQRINPPSGALSINTKNLDKQFNQDMQTYQKASTVGKLGIDNILGEGSWQPVKTESAVMNPYVRDITPAPKSNPYLERIKMKVLNNPNLTPAAKNYLSKIPVSYEKFQPDERGVVPAGVAHGVRKGERGADIWKNPYIAINSDYKDSPNLPIGTKFEDGSVVTKESIASNAKEIEKTLETVIAHEMLHQSPRLFPTSLFHPNNKKVIDEYVQRWGKQYTSAPGALVEEMFAEKALPPAYYFSVFQSINPNASKQDFIGYLKSYFINAINSGGGQ